MKHLEANPSAGGEKPCLRAQLVVFGLYVVLATLLTWPLLPQLGTRLPMGAHDVWQNYWNLWWWKTALWERHQSPYSTDLLFYAQEVPLGLHTHSPANMLWTLPVNILFGVPAALNLALLAGFIFAGYGAFLLARHYTKSRGAGFLAGITFAFFPQHVEQALEHLNLASYQAMPFFLWALVATVRRGGRWWIPTGLFFSLNALLSWHNALMSIPLALGVVVFEVCYGQLQKRKVAYALVKSGALGMLLMAPFLWPILRDYHAGVAILQKSTVNKAIDPLFLILPHTGHPIWGELSSPIVERFRSYPSVGFVGYLGVVNILLVASGLLLLLRRKKGKGVETLQSPSFASQRGCVLLWLALTVFFLLLSFGDRLRLTEGYELEWFHLPFYWLKEIPLFGLVRVPNRFLVPAVLAMSVLVAGGAEAIIGRLPERGRRPFLTAIAALLIVDFLWLPFPMREIPRPEWTRVLGQLPKSLAVLDIPSGHRARAAKDLFLQTVHGRPIVGGYLSAQLHSVEETLQRFPVLRRIFYRYPPEEAYRGPALVDAIRQLGVGIVVVHLNRTVQRLRARRQEVRQAFPRDLYRRRLYNPENGIETATLERFRRELREAFGEPYHTQDGVVEVFLTRR